MTSIIKPNYQKQFLEYCEEDKLEELKQLLSEHQTHINIHSEREKAFRYTCKNGHIKIVKYLLSLDSTIYGQINIQAEDNDAFYMACEYDRLEIVKYLLSLDSDVYGIIDIHADDEYCFRVACDRYRLEIVKYLLSLDPNIYGQINIHANNEDAFRYACIYGRLELVKYLLSLDPTVYGTIDIHVQNNHAFHNACNNHHIDLVKYLCEICEDYSYKIIDDKIIPIIKRFDISDLKIVDVKEKVQCLICGESGETDVIINLNCKNKNGNTSLLHCYCVSCFEEIYDKYHKCSYCMQSIDKKRLHKVNIIPSE